MSVGRRLPRRIRAAAFHFAFNCANEEFRRFAYLYGSAPEESLSAISARGFSPTIVVDVGAYEGAWSRMVNGIWPRAKLIMIEPNLEKREVLEEVAAELG